MTRRSDIELPPALNPKRRWGYKYPTGHMYYVLLERVVFAIDLAPCEHVACYMRPIDINAWRIQCIEPYGVLVLKEFVVESIDPPFQLAEALYDAAS